MPKSIRKICRVSWQFALPFAALLAFVLLVRQCVVFVTTDKEYKPVSLMELSVTPDPVLVGNPVTFHNGVCLHQNDPLTVQVYLGLQDASGFPLLGVRTFDIIGSNTPEGRRRVTLTKGCTRESIDSIAPPNLPAGRWVVILTIVAIGPSGQTQVLTDRSNPFDIITSP